MGAQVSKTKNTTDIVNEFTTEVVMKALNKNDDKVNVFQTIDASCDPDVAKRANELCGDVLKIMASTNGDMSIRPAVCDACLIEDISMDSTVSISMQNINDNKVANDIKSELSSKLDSTLKSTQTGTLGYGNLNTESLTTLKNYVDTNFDVNLTNENLRMFDFRQDINLKNVSARRLSTKTVGTIIASAMVTNAMDTSSQVKGAIDALVKTESTQSGGLDNLERAFNNLVSTIGTAYMGTMGMFVLVGILLLIAAVVAIKSGLLCMIPIFAPACAVMGLNKSSSSSDDKEDEEEGDEEGEGNKKDEGEDESEGNKEEENEEE